MDFFIAARLPGLRNGGNLVISICPQNAVKPGQSRMNTEEEEEGRAETAVCSGTRHGVCASEAPGQGVVTGWAAPAAYKEQGASAYCLCS